MTPRRPPHRRRRTPPQRWWRGRALTRYGQRALSILVVVATLFLRERLPVLPTSKKEDDAAPPSIWAVDTRGDSWWGVSSPPRDVPATPFPKQKRPPCTPRIEEEILGGCWTLLGAIAPCPQDTFEHAGRCYIPTQAAPRPATSIED